MQSFYFDGCLYSLKDRYCNKKVCKCHDGNPHGPYWYARDIDTGRVSYVGKSLPARVTNFYDALRLFSDGEQVKSLKLEVKAAREHYEMLSVRLRLLQSVLDGGRITDKALSLLQELDFPFLVRPVGVDPKQETNK